uniref:Protein asunder n=1 Tax=Strongyloides papillosus TaxID=174720 RepID=A0A0N5CCM7_STREA
MVYTGMVENHTHKMFIILFNTESFSELSKLCNVFELKNGNELSFSRNYFSIVKEMLLEIQRIMVNLYKTNEKILNIITTDEEINEEDLGWNVDNLVYSYYEKVIGNMKLMGKVSEENVRNLLCKNIKKAINVLGKPTSEQMKFVRLFYKRNSKVCREIKSVKWWKYDNTAILNDTEDKNFSFFNNMGSLLLIVNNFDDESCENLFEVVRRDIIEHKNNIHGLNKLKGLRLIMINVINEETTLLKKYCTFDKISNVYFDRYNIHLNENSKETINSVLRDIFNLNSLTITNTPIKKDSNKMLGTNVEIYYPNTFLPFENLKKFQENGGTVVTSKRQYESINKLENVKSVEDYTATEHTVAWNSSHKRLPLLIQTLPFIFTDFGTSEEIFVNDYILRGKNVLPQLVLKNTPPKETDLAFTLSKNIDKSSKQIGIIDEIFYETKKLDNSGYQRLGDEKIARRMANFINECTSNIVNTDEPGLIIDNELKQKFSISLMHKLPCSSESNDCFRSELNRITKLLLRIDSIDSTYPYLKAIIESKERSKNEIKCILDVISNFRYVSNSHEELFEDFYRFYFKDQIHYSKVKKLGFPRNKIKITPTNKNLIEIFLKEKEDKKPEFAGWINSNNKDETIMPLYSHLKNDELRDRVPFKSKYVVQDNDEIQLSEYTKYIPTSSGDYLKIAPPPYIGGGISNEKYGEQIIEYRNYVNTFIDRSLSRDGKFEIERACEKFRLPYSNISTPLESTYIQTLDLRKRRKISDINFCDKKIPKIVNVNLNESVAMTNNELCAVKKTIDDYRKSLRGQLISIDDYIQKIKNLKSLRE